MADILSAAARSERMRRIKQRDTEPEIALRHGLHRMGLRYRLNGPGLPGRPDIVFPKYRVALFVHGCFWHRHSCRAGRPPVSNATYWESKLAANVRRDRRKASALRALGWCVLAVWECQLKGSARKARTVARVAARVRASPARGG